MPGPESVFKQRTLGRVVFFSLLTVLLLKVKDYVPAVSFWGLFFSPLPLALLGCREGRRSLGLGVLMTGGLTALLLSIPSALYFVTASAPLSAALAASSRKSWSGGEALLACTFVSVTEKLFFFFLLWALTGRNFLAPDAGQVEEMMGRLYAGFSSGFRETISTQENMRQAAALLPYMTPSMLLLYAGLDALCNYKLCGYFQRGQAHRPPALPAFTEWRFPKSLLSAFFLAFVINLLWGLDDWRAGALFAANLELVLNVLFFVEGLSLAFWWIGRRGVGPVLRTLAAVLFLIPLAWPWQVLMGIGDIVFDFRSRATRRRT